jgi:hypothetical protein
MRRILLGLMIILTLSNTAYGAGPVINGFYIGMPRQKAIDNVNNLRLTINTISDNFFELIINERNNNKGYYGYITFDKKVISDIRFDPQLAFNLQAMDFDIFVYEFCINYKLPYAKIDKRADNLYVLKNYDEGYMIGFTTALISITRLQKPSELQLK